MREKMDSLGKELADVGIGAGLVVAGSELAKNVFEEMAQATGSGLNFLPESQSVGHALGVGLETIEGLTGIAAVSLILYAGFKKLISPAFKENK